MSSYTTFLLFFMSVGVMRIQGFRFPSDDVSNSYLNFRNYGSGGSSSDANADAKIRFDNGFGESTSNAETKVYGGNNGYANSYSETENYGYGGFAKSGSNSGTHGGHGHSGSDAQADTFLDQNGNAHSRSSSHSHSGYGESNSASASATTGINKFGEPVAAVATGTASAGPDGQSSAMSSGTVSGGHNYHRFYN